MQILEELLFENDSVSHTWYLLALAYYGGGCFDEAAETLEHGCKLLDAQDAEEEARLLWDELRERIVEGQQLDSAVRS